MTVRKNNGATLALVATSAFIIVIVGIAFFFLSRLLGGDRELQAAVDSGSLNVAKQALISPAAPNNITIASTGPIGLILNGCLTPPGGSPGSTNPNSSNLDIGSGLNLITFNNLVGDALLVALNAEADAEAGYPAGMSNAQQVVDFVEGTAATSLGSQLTASLTSGSNWGSAAQVNGPDFVPQSNNNLGAQYYFNVTGQTSLIRMLNTSNTGYHTDTTWNPGDYKVAYMDASPGANKIASVGNGASNVSVDAYLPQQAPVITFNYPDGFNAAVVNGSASQNNNVSMSLPTLMPWSQYTTTTASNGQVTQPSQISAPANMSVSNPDNSGNYLSGYQQITISGGGKTITLSGVPVEPGRQPHLVSKADFANATNAPVANVVVPPNAFLNGATAIDAHTQLPVHKLAAAIVGIPQQSGTATDSDPNKRPYAPSIPYGYIKITNPSGNSASSTLNIENVAANQLLNGIPTNSETGAFSLNSALITALTTGQVPGAGGSNSGSNANIHSNSNGSNNTNLASYVQGLLDKTNSALGGDRNQGLYDPLGNQILNYDKPTPSGANSSGSQYSALTAIPRNSTMFTCKDTNSSTTPICEKEAGVSVNSQGQDAFDKAYYPNQKDGYQTLTSSNLTAAEQAQCKAIDLYGNPVDGVHGGGPAEEWNFSSTSGLRLYNNGQIPANGVEYPWAPPAGTLPSFNDSDGNCGCTKPWSSTTNACQVTAPGTVTQLCAQTQPGVGGHVVARFLAQRIFEIKPGATQTDLNTVFDKPIEMGQTFYVYLNQATQQIQCTSSTDPTLSKSAPWIFGIQAYNGNKDPQPDGQSISITNTYNIFQGMIDPHYAAAIHDQLFTQWGTSSPNYTDMNIGGSTSATDTALIQTASGASGLLGQISFSESVGGNGGGGGGGGGGSFGMNSRD